MTDVSRILCNMKNVRQKLNRLEDDLTALQKALIYIGDKSEDADRQVSNVLLGRGYMNIIDDTRDTVSDFMRHFQGWFDSDNESNLKDNEENDDVIYYNPVHTIILNGDGTEEVQPDGSVHVKGEIEIVNTPSYTVDNNVIKLSIPGIGEVILDEFPVGSKYPNRYTVVINGVSTYLAGAQCLGFARYVHEKMYGDHHISGENDSFTRTYYNIARGTLDAGTLKQLIMQSGVGAHIRTNAKTAGGWGHSMIVAGITEEGLTIIDANGDGNGTVAVKTYTWDEYMSRWGSRGIEYIETYNG